MLIFEDLIYYIRIGMKYLFKGKFVETPDMEKAKRMRDRALIVQKEGVNNK